MSVSNAVLTPSISSTNTCLYNLGVASFACAPPAESSLPDVSTCCPAMTAFNDANCFCSPLAVAQGGQALQGLKGFFAQACQGTVVEQESCPAPPTGECTVDANTLDAMRFQALQQFAGSLTFGVPYEESVALYEQLFVDDAMWELKGTGAYIGPIDILEYARIADPTLNSQVGNQFQAISNVNPATVRFYLEGVTYGTNSKYCFGQTPGSTSIEPNHSNCMSYFETAASYEVNFAPCSNKIQYIWTVVPKEAFTGLLGGIDSLYDTCARIQGSCTGEYQVYDSVQDCYDYVSQRPLTACQDLQLMGPSRGCVWLHSALVASDKNHCFHTGKEVADLKGEYKCNPMQCIFGFTSDYRAAEGLCPDTNACCTSTEARCGEATSAITECVGAFDPYCTTDGWDDQCKQEAIDMCGLVC